MPVNQITHFHFISISLYLLSLADSLSMPSSRASSWSGRGSRASRGRGKARQLRGSRTYCHQRKQPAQYPGYRRPASITPSQVSSTRQATPAPSVRIGTIDDTRDDDFLEQVILAVDIKEKGKVGCAYYIAGEERLLCMEEVIGGGAEVVEKCSSSPLFTLIC